jgi:hypothetical protein
MFGIPDRDVREVVRAGVTVAVADIDDAPIAESHRGGEPGIAQRECDIVAPREMLVDQRPRSTSVRISPL